MSEDKAARKRPRKRGYVPRSNAIHVTVYDPTGRALKPEVADEVANVVNDVALENHLLIGLART